MSKTVALARVSKAVIPEVIAPKLAEYRETASFLETYVVDSDDLFLEAQEYLDNLGEEMKDFEKEKKKHTKPAYDAWQNELKAYDEPKKLLEGSIAKLKALIGDYKLAKAAQDQAALQQAVHDGDEEGVALDRTTPKGSASVKISYTFRVVDPKIVPDKYCMKTVNMRLIEHDVDGGVREIPGVEIYPKADVRRVGRRSNQSSDE